PWTRSAGPFQSRLGLLTFRGDACTRSFRTASVGDFADPLHVNRRLIVGRAARGWVPWGSIGNRSHHQNLVPNVLFKFRGVASRKLEVIGRPGFVSDSVVVARTAQPALDAVRERRRRSCLARGAAPRGIRGIGVLLRNGPGRSRKQDQHYEKSLSHSEKPPMEFGDGAQTYLEVGHWSRFA